MGTLLGALLKQARRAHSMTLRGLAEIIGCPPSLLSELENGIRIAPKNESLLTKLADALGLKAEDVFDKARQDREQRNPKRLRDILRQDDELAAVFYRVSTDLTDEELRVALLRTFQELDTGNAQNG